jgi:hypothetical protein
MKTMMTYLALLLPAAAMADEPATELARQAAAAHGRDAALAKRAVSADLVVTFGGNKVVDGTFLFSVDAGRARYTPKAGGLMVFDGQKAWVAPGTKNVGPPPRFHLLTWPYFAMAGTKLTDPGTKHADAARGQLSGKPVDTFKLTFDGGVGDAPDDWYVVHVDADTRRVSAMAYIVTYGTPRAEAEKSPNVIVYGDYETVDGVALSRRWQFFDWSPERGPVGQPTGEATLSNVRFVDPPADAFARPADAVEDPAPTKK